MRRIALLLALTTAALLAAGCGAAESSDEEQVTPGPQAFTAQEVIREFEQAPGQPQLRVAGGTGASWEQLGFGLDPPAGLQRRYGTFNVYVVEPGNDEALSSLLSNKETKEPLEADANGVYWELDTLAGSYVGYKRYGANVVVAWWSETREPVADARFKRLDGLMRGLATG